MTQRPTDSNDIHVAIAADSRYLPWAATLILSCVKQHRDGITIHLLQEGGIEQRAIDLLAGMVSDHGGTLDVPTVDRSPLEVVKREARFGGHTALLRLLLPASLPDLPRIVYLDVDTLVVRPLDDLWRLDLDGRTIAAAPNVVEPAMYPHVRSLGIELEDCFNSGVLVIDLDALRSNGAFDRTIAVLSGLPYAPWFDQDALNVVFAGRWQRLHPRWNAMNSLWVWRGWADEVFEPGTVDEATTDPAILHFEGPALAKPWHYLSQHPWRERYRSLTAETPWAGTQLEERNPLTRAIGTLPSSWQLPAYARLFRAKQRLARLKTRP